MAEHRDGTMAMDAARWRAGVRLGFPYQYDSMKSGKWRTYWTVGGKDFEHGEAVHDPVTAMDAALATRPLSEVAVQGSSNDAEAWRKAAFPHDTPAQLEANLKYLRVHFAEESLKVQRVTDAMVSRFLSWKLPADFGPDGGISFSPPSFSNGWPIGTNLFTADQARGMLEYILSAED